MSDTPQPTPEELAAQKLAERQVIQKRADELKALAGKSFALPGDSTLMKVIDYGGVIATDGGLFHTLIVERPGARWRPKASEFLEAYKEVQVPAQEQKSQEVK